MIYEFEKIELFGISWLNYAVIGLLLTILLIILTVLWLKKTILKNCQKLSPEVILGVFYILGALTLVCTISTLILCFSGNYRSHPVPLSTIDNKITVQGEKVVINELDELYDYKDYTNNDHQMPRKDIKQIFKFEYDELFESGKLTNENGDYYKLSKEDIKYLKEKGGK